VPTALSRLRGPFRLSLVVWLVVGLIGAGGVAYLVLDKDTEVVYVAARDLPAYHQLTRDDVRMTTVRARDVPQDAIRDQRVLLDRYTLAAIRRGQPYGQARLGPRLAAGSLAGPLVALRADAETTMGGRITQGDRVDVVMSESTIRDALVVDVVDGPNAAVILRVPASEVADVAPVRGDDGPVIVRTRPYSGP
jgi:Flp pilus assembly protein CpaB